MIINGKTLLQYAPIKNMLETKVKEHGVSHGLAEAGYDIRLKQDIKFDFYGHDFLPYTKLDGGDEMKGRFTLASAIEEFDMPSNLVGVVHDKSTWARRGVSVFNTVIEPGWKGFLTLEIVFHGNQPVHIPAGAGIAQVLFSKTIEDGNYGGGKYQNQEDRPVEARS